MVLLLFVGILAISGVLGTFDTFQRQPSHSQTKLDRDTAVFDLLMGLVVGVMRWCGMTNNAIRFVLGFVALMAFGGIAASVFYLRWTAPKRPCDAIQE